jgi:hypothetical protein
MSNAWVCPKCHFPKTTKVQTYRLETKYRMETVLVNAYICDNCNYVELYRTN